MNDQHVGPAAIGVAALLIVAAVLAALSSPVREDDTEMGEHDMDDNPQIEPDLTGRPRPVHDAAVDASKIVGTIGGVVTALVGFGILTGVQGDAVTGLLGLLPGLVAAASAVWSAMRTRTNSEESVTPVSDPMRWVGGVLTELVPARGNREG